ncbi:MAG: hypothetical protein ACRC5M_01360 [Anaeroplasmataceae bacterium]
MKTIIIKLFEVIKYSIDRWILKNPSVAIDVSIAKLTKDLRKHKFKTASCIITKNEQELFVNKLNRDIFNMDKDIREMCSVGLTDEAKKKYIMLHGKEKECAVQLNYFVELSDIVKDMMNILDEKESNLEKLKAEKSIILANIHVLRTKKQMLKLSIESADKDSIIGTGSNANAIVKQLHDEVEILKECNNLNKQENMESRDIKDKCFDEDFITRFLND